MKLKEIAKKIPNHLKLEAHVDHYLDVYEKYFSDYKDKKTKFLEIGVAYGGSLAIWKEYFSDVELHGIDISDHRNPQWQFTKVDSEIHIGSQDNPNFLNKVGTKYGKFDIILDDGGHKTHQQIISLQNLWKYLNSGGIYIIEDLHTSYWPTFITTERTTIDVLLQEVHKLNKIHQTRQDCWSDSEYFRMKDQVKVDLEYIHFYDSIAILKKK